MKNKKLVLFSTGPANISDKVRSALCNPDICHRDTEFTEMLKSIKEHIASIFRLPGGYETIIFSGSGSAAIEGVVSSFGNCPKKILIISNGVYGERAREIARVYGINFEEMKLPWGEMPDLDKVEEMLKDDVFCAVYVVHHETTTGLLNPIKDLSRIAKKYGKLVLTDAISSIAGEELDMKTVDAAIGSANKCIRGVPGASFVIGSRRFLDFIDKYEGRSFYNNLKLYRKMESSNQTPFTPPVQVCYALLEALKELKREGLDKRISAYKETAAILRKGLKGMGLKTYIPEEHMSNTMTTIYTPEGHTYASLYAQFKKKGFVIYSSQGPLAGHTFRLGTVGIISKEEIKEFLSIFRGLLCGQ